MKNDNKIPFPGEIKKPARENGRVWFEHYTRNKNRAKILQIAEQIFINKLASLPGDVFYDDKTAANIALQCLSLGETFVTEVSEKLWIQEAAKEPDPGQE